MGGYPNPIFNNKMVSMPIPEENSSHYYNELQIDYNIGIQNFISLLYNNFDFKKTCHLDPDINKAILKDRNPNWKALFGQTGITETVLKN